MRGWAGCLGFCRQAGFLGRFLLFSTPDSGSKRRVLSVCDGSSYVAVHGVGQFRSARAMPCMLLFPVSMSGHSLRRPLVRKPERHWLRAADELRTCATCRKRRLCETQVQHWQAAQYVETGRRDSPQGNSTVFSTVHP
jgi:hypothetical protein